MSRPGAHLSTAATSRRAGFSGRNTSRGEVLDTATLAAAIRGKQIAGAAIDVFDPEPPPTDYPLLGFDKLLLTPHMAAQTHTAVENMSWVVCDVVDVLNGRMPTYPAP